MSATPWSVMGDFLRTSEECSWQHTQQKQHSLHMQQKQAQATAVPHSYTATFHSSILPPSLSELPLPSLSLPEPSESEPSSLLLPESLPEPSWLPSSPVKKRQHTWSVQCVSVHMTPKHN
jgi:hypothetical protein